MTMNTKTKFFETKEQYLNFRKAFALAVNDPRSKKSKPQPPNGYIEKGWMTGAHYMLLNCIRDLPFNRGFTPYTKSLVLQNGIDPDHNIDYNRRVLESVINSAKLFAEAKPAEKSSFWRWGKVSQEEANKKQQDGYRNHVKSFIEPFGDAITIEDIARVNINSGMTEMVDL